MLDRDLALLYGVETRRLNEQVKRNIERFPDDFMFQLSETELADWMSHFATSNSVTMGMRKRPFAFTENGVAMLSGILRSKTAIETNIRIMRTFNFLRHRMPVDMQVVQRLEAVENSQAIANKRLIEHDRCFERVFDKLEQSDKTIEQGIFYDGQIFDAYVFIADLIRQAKKKIVLIDNYVNETVLTLLDKRGPSVKATIYTARMTEELKLDVEKHNEQYAPIEIQLFRHSHDRFLCIDEDVYLIGASMKDLGRKWFGFSKIKDTTPQELIDKINQ